jgi:DNA-directed RNA polymerase subunit RPC12/RpoP
MPAQLSIADIMREVPACPACGNTGPFAQTAGDISKTDQVSCAHCGEDILATYRYLIARMRPTRTDPA